MQRYQLDPQNPPRLSKTDFARLDRMQDKDIDYSDIRVLQNGKEVKTENTVYSYVTDEGWPLGIGVQAQVSNHGAAAAFKRCGRERVPKSPDNRAGKNTEDERKQTVECVVSVDEVLQKPSSVCQLGTSLSDT
jgi:hypothetical protein